MPDYCKTCNGNMVGDGYTLVYHCEFANYDDVYDKEPDADPVYCTMEDEVGTFTKDAWDKLIRIRKI